jgi:hypothetical protein
MDYQQIYSNLIESAKARLESLEYFETHHIIPTSLGGTDEETNLVKLSFREHYLAHWLLCKIANSPIEKYKMSCAFFIMSKGNNGLRLSNSRLYDRAKRIFKSEYSAFLNSDLGKESLKARAIKRIALQQKDFIFHFYHQDFGDLVISTNNLKLLYPEQHLSSSNLVKVGKAERPSHKGWILFENAHIGIDGFLLKKKEKMSISAENRFKNLEHVESHKLFSGSGARAQKGFKKHYHPEFKPIKALPGSEKSNNLIEKGYILK